MGSQKIRLFVKNDKVLDTLFFIILTMLLMNKVLPTFKGTPLIHSSLVSVLLVMRYCFCLYQEQNNMIHLTT